MLNRLTLALFAGLLGLAAAPVAQAQSYQPFGPSRTYYYREAAPAAGVADSLFLFRVDSVGVAGADSVFYFNRTMPALSSAQWYLPKRINLFGGWMRWNAATGTATFGAVTTSATVEIRTRAPLNQPWAFGATGLTAQLTGRSAGSALGVPDTLLSVSISDGQTLLIGRRMGLVSGPCFAFYLGRSYSAPYLRRELTLAAIPELVAAPTLDLRWENIWNVQPGDRLFYRTTYNATSGSTFPNPGPSGPSSVTLEVQHITQRTVGASGDTIILLSQDTVSTTTYPNANWSGASTTTYATHTTTLTQARPRLPFLTHSVQSGSAIICVAPALQSDSVAGGRPVITYQGRFVARFYYLNDAAPGLGEVRQYEYSSHNGASTENIRRLVGYVKDGGATYWGNIQAPQPLAAPAALAAALPATLAPNPAPAGAAPTLSFALDQPQTVSLTLYDALGRLAWQHTTGTLAAGSQRLAVAAGTGLAPGLYRLRVTLADGRQRLLPLVRE